MAWRFHGRATVSATSPRAWGICDRCYLLYDRSALVLQYEWRGNSLKSLGIYVCTVTCLDKPQQQLRPQILPPDPVPILQPRPESYGQDNAGSSPDPAAVYPDGGIPIPID